MERKEGAVLDHLCSGRGEKKKTSSATEKGRGREGEDRWLSTSQSRGERGTEDKGLLRREEGRESRTLLKERRRN